MVTRIAALFGFPEGLEKPGKVERRGQRRKHVKRVTSLLHVILVAMPCVNVFNGTFTIHIHNENEKS